MRILISRISDGTRGGAEVSAFDQAYVLKNLGHEVLFVNSIPDLVARAQQAGIQTESLPWPHKGVAPFRYIYFMFNLPRFIIKCSRLVKQFNPDVINPHSRDDQIVFTLARPFHNKPVVWKDAGDMRHTLQQERKNFFGKWYEKRYRKAISKADAIYMLSEDDVMLFKEKTGYEKVYQIPSSILYADYDLRSAPQMRSKMVVGYIGRLTKMKGINYFIDAIKMLDKDIEFWIYGDGEEKENLVHQASGDMRIKFLPFTDEIPSYLNSMDIVVVPSVVEGWGRIIKEAMYFSKPIVGSRVGGIAAQIEDQVTGLLFEPENPKDLAEKLAKLIADSDLREALGANAHAKALKDGDFTEIVKQQILPIYERVVNELRD